mmetsp:Transcript_20821/g.62237  ORF Transcript_20821/g.62237 Transcript_20821/m.62237 type:complete len:247 (+) Transcript_20821:1132-1872(+)
MLAMHSRPDKSWSATLRKRSRGFAMLLLKLPAASTLEKALSSAPRGTRTLSNHSLPLSTPLQPILWPMSSMRTPRHTDMSSLRMRTSSAWMPRFSPPTMSCANTAHQCACTAPLVIQYFCASGVGVWTTNSCVALSYVAVVCISTALLPKPSSVRPKHPTASSESILRSSGPWCCAVPSFSTVPPNRLNCTVIFVAMLGSQNAAISCAAKIASGLVRNHSTLTKPASQMPRRRASASSRSSRRSMS